MKRRNFLAAVLTACATIGVSRSRGNAQPEPLLSGKLPVWVSDNIFLQGINAPVFQEVDLDHLDVTGEIPSDLQGIYIRNGANPRFQPIAYAYPLEGDGMLHAMYFDHATVRYRNRWILNKGLIYEMQAGKALPELRFRNYANTSIVGYADKLLALYETGLPYHITPDLETVGEWDFNGDLEQAMTAHPRLDPQTGELHFYRYSLFTEPYLTYYVANPQGQMIRSLPIDLPRPALIHDMAMSENYVIFVQAPLVIDVQQAMQCGNPFVWRSDLSTRIGLIHRQDYQKSPIWIEADPFWVWHFMNAYETDRELVIDYIHYPEIKLESTLDAVLQNRSNLQQMRIDLDTKTVKQIPIDDRTVEFPIIDRRQTGKPYRYGYTSHFDLELAAQKGIPNYVPELVQYDIVHQTTRVHRFKAGCYGGEALIVPKAQSTSELDSYVMTWVFDEHRQASDLVIIDAAQFDQAPIAQIHLPVRVPMGAHGSWIA